VIGAGQASWVAVVVAVGLFKASTAAAARRAAPASAAAPAGAAVAAVVDPAAAQEVGAEAVVEAGVDGDNRAVGKCWFQVSGVRELGEGRTSE
jgi:hypothetical protein